jgi:ribosomal protein S21
LPVEPTSRRVVRLVQVRLREGENFESLLRRFKSGIEHTGVIREYRRHQAFMSRGERARVKARRALRKQMRRMRQAA